MSIRHLLMAAARAIGIYVGDISRSLRFRAGASPILTRTFASSGNLRKWTYSSWVKKSNTSAQILFGHINVGGTVQNILYIDASDILNFYAYYSGGYVCRKALSMQYRDPAAWVHIVISYDSSNATAADRMKVSINGVRQTNFSASIDPALDLNSLINDVAYPLGIGRSQADASLKFDGNMARLCFVDGEALDAGSFGYLNTKSNAWVSKNESQVKSVVDAGGANSWMLDFDNATSLTTLGADKSSKGNNWTLSGFSITPGVTYDSMLDTPSNNFATLNYLSSAAHSLSNGNLTATLSAAVNPRLLKGTMFPSSGKFYTEYVYTSGSSIGSFGVADLLAVTDSGGLNTANSVIYFGNGVIYKNGVSAGSFATWTINDTISVAQDIAAGTVAFYKNNVLITTITGMAVTGYSPAAFANNTGDSFSINFGQRPFTYTPPSGFKSLCTANMPETNTAARNPKAQFDVVLAGTGIKAVADAVFPSNCLEIIKSRTVGTNNWQWVDSVRGMNNVLRSNLTDAETGSFSGVSNGVGYVWKAGGADVANTAGDIASRISANRDAGFSIVTYTGTGINGTVGHGLARSPGLVIVKRRNVAGFSWPVWCTGLAGGEYMVLDLNQIRNTAGSIWNSTAPSATVNSVGTHGTTNEAGGTYVMYSYADVEGYQKIGTYVGNGLADGPFVYCGFRPRFLRVKGLGEVSSWWIYDSARDTYNPANTLLVGQLTSAEQAQGFSDFTSNGFKIRNTGLNTNGQVYTFHAVSEQAFNFANGR